MMLSGLLALGRQSSHSLQGVTMDLSARLSSGSVYVYWAVDDHVKIVSREHNYRLHVISLLSNMSRLCCVCLLYAVLSCNTPQQDKPLNNWSKQVHG